MLRQKWKGKPKSEWSSMNKAVAEAWRKLSDEDKTHYARLAGQVQNRRAALASTPLNQLPPDDECEDGEAPPLSRNQRDRLNQARLDGALTQVAHYPAWTSGLGLSDHISGLRADLVDMGFAEATGRGALTKLEEAFQDFFAYDSQILPNPQLPAFDRACTVPHGGVCASTAIYKYIAKLVDQLDTFLAFHDKLSRRVLIRSVVNLREWVPSRLSLQIPPGICQPVWFALGCAGRRPKNHVLINLVSLRDSSSLAFQTINGGPSLQTSHQFFEKLLKQHQELNQPPCHFGLEVTVFDDYSALIEDDEFCFRFNIQKAWKSDSFQVGHGFVPPRSCQPNPRGAASRLRFGLGSLVEPQPKRAKPATSGADGNQQLQKKQRDVHFFSETALAPQDGVDASPAAALASSSSSSAIPAETEALDQDQDVYPLHLTKEASSEFRNAAISSEAAAADLLSSEPAENLPRTSTNTGKSYFHQKTGILSMGHVKRAGVKCYHCTSSIDKAELRFEFAFDKRKPARSIHTGCLVQMDSEARKNSLETLEGLLMSCLSADERSHCEEAVAVLRSV
eukprot:s1002_g14.t1